MIMLRLCLCYEIRYV